MTEENKISIPKEEYRLLIHLYSFAYALSNMRRVPMGTESKKDLRATIEQLRKKFGY